MKRLQEEFGNAPRTDEQYVVWRDAWEAWREPWEYLDDSLTYYAEELGLDRSQLEAAMRTAASHVPLSVEE